MILDALSSEELVNLRQARILYYDFFYGLFVFELLDSRCEIALRQLELLSSTPLNQESQDAMKLLKRELEDNGIKGLKAEFSVLFALPFGEKQVGMHISHYYENCLAGQSLLKMKEFVRQSAVRVNADNFKETEEHLGFLFGFMRYLLESKEEELARGVFAFSKDAIKGLVREIIARRDARLYRALAIVLDSFVEFEMDYYAR